MNTKKMFFFKTVFTSVMLLLAMQVFISTKAWAADTWSTVGTAEFSEPATMVKMVVDSKGTCYVAYDDTANGSKITVKKFNGTSWENVGSPNFSKGQICDLNLCIGSDDVIYAAYRDMGIGYGCISVQKFSSGTWQDLKSDTIYTGALNYVDYVGMAIDNYNVPYILYSDHSKNYQASVKKYNGTSWDFVGKEGGVSSSQICNVYMGINPKNNYPYVAYMDSNNQKGSVTTYNGSSWSYLGGKNAINFEIFYNSLAFDSSGTPYLAYRDGGSDIGKAYVNKWNGSKWESVGSGTLSNYKGDAENIVFDSHDNLYLAYKDISGTDFGMEAYGKPVVKKYDKTNWSVVGDAGFSPIRIGNLSEVIRNDNLYVAYVYDQYASGSNKKITVKKFGSQIVQASGITATVASKTVPEANKIMLTVTPAASDANHKVYYRVVNTAPSAMNVGDVITLTDWTAISNTYPIEITAADGKYIEAVEITTADNKVTKWGKSGVTEDGYVAAAAKATANPTGGAVAPGTLVYLTSATSGATIHYTTDGTTPTVTSMIYNGVPIGINTATTIQAIAVKAGMSNSDMMTESYTVMERVAAPTANPDGGGTVAKGTKVTLSTTTIGAAIYYTLDGKNPTTSSNLYTGPITLNESTTIIVMAAKDGMMDSTEVVENYFVPKDAPAAPVANPKGGQVPLGTVVTLTSATAGAEIHYTLDGSIPTTSSAIYSKEITITNDVTIKAIAMKSGMTTSSAISESYTVAAAKRQAKDPVASPRSGEVADGTEINLTSPDGAAILYTTDGRDPYTYGTVYTHPIVVNSAFTIKAVAISEELNCSDVMTESYTVIPRSQVAAPVASPKGGQVSSGTVVTLTSATLGVEIRYTVDGSVPTTSSAIYTNGITITKDVTIKAVAMKSGMTTSSAISESYTVAAVKKQAQDPVVSPRGGSVAAGTTVTLTSPDGIAIYYTTDGSDPYKNGILYTNAIIINAPITIKAITSGQAFNCSDMIVESYTVTNNNNTTPTAGDKDNDKTTNGGTSNGGGSIASGVQTETRTVDVVAGEQKESGITPVKVEITRTVESGTKVDTVKLDETKITETIAKAIENKKNVATVIVTDLKDNPADVVQVQISKTAANKLADKGIGLKVDTPKAKIEVPKETLGSVSGDIKFNINEVTDPNKISSTKGLVLKANGDSNIIGNPVEIESNYKGRTEITIPLKTENLPKDPEELKKVLDSLSVYVEHSDGEKVTQKGEIVYDEKGNPVGISIWVDKFSTFTVVSLSQEGQKKANVDNNTSSTGSSNNAAAPEIKFVGLGHSPLVEGDKEDFIISSGFDGSVQYRIYLNVNGTWKEVTNGYSAAVSGKETFTVTPDYAFQKGQYQGRVYVKKAGNKGSKEENGIDYDNYYTYNINCVDRDDVNRVYTTGKLNVSKDTVKAGEKVTITGVEGISGITGPYFYRLHIYDVANDKWTNNVVPYSEKLEWMPSAAGTYVLDVHVITPNSVLWDNVQNDPSLIYGGYEGWRLKTIKVN